MAKLLSINPANGSLIKEFDSITEQELMNKISIANNAFQEWRFRNLSERILHVKNLTKLLEAQKNDLAKIITIEMGKVYHQSVAEIDKCIQLANYYIDNSYNMLADEYVSTNYDESYIKFDPLGVILAIMPWNFPFWQVLRAAIPNIILGNVILLKHASNVQLCATKIEEIFNLAGFPQGVFQNLLITSSMVEQVISNEFVRGVTLTGSDKTGSIIASLAGREIKKVVMELGGSDPFLVLSDVNLTQVCQLAAKARVRNAGQACTSPKRFIVMHDIFESFVEVFAHSFKELRIGDPLDDVDVGPLVSEEALNTNLAQIHLSIEKGAKLILGGRKLDRKGFFIEPTILSDVRKGMPVYDEEVFGPVAVFIRVHSVEEMIQIANDTKYGLTASIWTKDRSLAKEIARKLDVGSVYINSVPSSVPDMPFGGVKNSGYGREMSRYGLLEFANLKSMFIQ